MRLPLALILSLSVVAVAAPQRVLEAGVTEVQAAEADEAWRAILARAAGEKKPVVVFFRSEPCPRCDHFERQTVPHPATQRRLPAVIFATLPATAGEAGRQWGSADSGVAFFARGVLRARWPIVPDTTNFGIILDAAVAVAPHFERAGDLEESGARPEADLEIAAGLVRLGRYADARAALDRAAEAGSNETRQSAVVAGALLDARTGNAERALRDLQRVVASPATPKLGGEAWMVIGSIQRATGDDDEAGRAFQAAVEGAEAGSPVHVAAQQALAAIRVERALARDAVRILPLGRQIVSGRCLVRTRVTSPAVASVAFLLDGRELRRVDRPPYSAALDLGPVPARRSIGVIAFDRKGREIGRGERVVNEAGETFWIRLVEPRQGPAGGSVRVVMDVRVPAARAIRSVAVSWNDADRTVLERAPFEAVIAVPPDQAGVLRAVAELDDGRISEDAVLLNAGGAAGRANVTLVEMPITVIARRGELPELTPDRITVREGNTVRRVESIAAADETPLTVGLLLDVSDSMQRTLPDLQEAAIRFLETVLGQRDRAFLITFDSRARLTQPATSDLALLRRQIASTRPGGLTALHDAMVLGLLQFEGIRGRRALIVFSDGVDRTSQSRAADVVELARRVNVPIHFIAAPPGLPPSADPDAQRSAGRTLLEVSLHVELGRLARATGGSSHALDERTELPEVYARIERALRAQVIAFVRTDPGTAESEWRSVRVEVQAPDVEVHAPEGYTVTW